MGHIDHGKSTLLDFIRKTKIVDKEAGGITQHIGAYEVTVDTKESGTRKITFLDTPGHEAFTALRARGVTVASIAVLVVSTEDGVKPQTLEALKYILTSGIPYIVALTKIDKPQAHIERTKQSLAENGIYIEGYGGTVPAVAVSAKTGEGIPELLEMVALMADVDEKKGTPQKPAEGVVIEAHMDKMKGICATLIISDGTLKTGMTLVAKDALSPVRLMEDFMGKKIVEATFSSPIKVIGWNKVPQVGSSFVAYEKKRDAEEAVETALLAEKKAPQQPRSVATPDDKPVVPLIIKADVMGTLEAIKHELAKLPQDRLGIKIIQEGVGEVIESDVKSASATEGSIIVGFNVKIDSSAKAYAERTGIAIAQFDIIYKLTEWIAEVLKERTPKLKVAEISGEAKILKIFSKVKDRQILGGKVTSGLINLGDTVKILRRDAEIGEGVIKELQQQKLKTKTVETGREFGAMIESKLEIAQGDRITAFTVVEK